VALCDSVMRYAAAQIEATKNSAPPSRRFIAISALRISTQRTFWG
jgi:hypothetical protein